MKEKVRNSYRKGRNLCDKRGNKMEIKQMIWNWNLWKEQLLRQIFV